MSRETPEHRSISGRGHPGDVLQTLLVQAASSTLLICVRGRS